MWPGLQAVASKFNNKPVLFLAVNSGTPRSQVQSYLRKNRIGWPAIADIDRSFERTCGVPAVSLKNILQMRILRPDGRLVSTSSTRLEATLTQALADASWNVDPQGIPASLKRTWFQVEFGNFSAAAAAVKKAIKSRKTETKEAGTRLKAYVEKKMQAQLTAAKKAEDEKKLWEAYEGYNDATGRFKGYALPGDLPATVRRLAAEKEVQREIKALRTLATARRKLGSKSASARKGGLRMLRQLADQQPDTQAGQVATKLLGQSTL